jgi:hypothetical protein
LQEPISSPPLSTVEVRAARVRLALEMLELVLIEGPLQGEVRQRATEAEKSLLALARVV